MPATAVNNSVRNTVHTILKLFLILDQVSRRRLARILEILHYAISRIESILLALLDVPLLDKKWTKRARFGTCSDLVMHARCNVCWCYIHNFLFSLNFWMFICVYVCMCVGVLMLVGRPAFNGLSPHW